MQDSKCWLKHLVYIQQRKRVVDPVELFTACHNKGWSYEYEIKKTTRDIFITPQSLDYINTKWLLKHYTHYVLPLQSSALISRPCARVINDTNSLLLQDQLLFCDDCDRGYHMYCLSPPMSEPPEGTHARRKATQCTASSFLSDFTTFHNHDNIFIITETWNYLCCR